MANAVGFIFTLCIFAAAVAHAHEKPAIQVEGDVYCDPCRVQFVTQLSRKLTGATVRLECTDLETKAVTYSVEGVTGADGHYTLNVIGDHPNDKCEVAVVKSPHEDCSEPMGDFDKSVVVCTDNTGIHSAVRYANPIGFMTSAALPQCASVLSELDILDTQ
ncbi:hypothetical protein ACS0TY_017071 [Phlomoides rotata]